MPIADDEVAGRLASTGMDRIWQWAWDRYGARYLGVITIVAFASGLPVFLSWSWIVLAAEKSSRYGAAFIVAVVVGLAMSLFTNLPGRQHFRGAKQWAAGIEVDRAKALEDTYAWSRANAVRAMAVAVTVSKMCPRWASSP